MSETFGGDYIYTMLSDSSAVTDKTTAIYNARMIPRTETNMTTINFYRIGVFNAAQEFFQTDWSVDCRAASDHDAIDLASAVKDALNRKDAAVSSYEYYTTVQIGQVIPPANEADVYNVPVTVTVRRK